MEEGAGRARDPALWLGPPVLCGASKGPGPAACSLYLRDLALRPVLYLRDLPCGLFFTSKGPGPAPCSLHLRDLARVPLVRATPAVRGGRGPGPPGTARVALTSPHKQEGGPRGGLEGTWPARHRFSSRVAARLTSTCSLSLSPSTSAALTHEEGARPVVNIHQPVGQYPPACWSISSSRLVNIHQPVGQYPPACWSISTSRLVNIRQPVRRARS